MHPKIATLTAQEQIEIEKKAFDLLKTDSFFIGMVDEFDESTALISAIKTATNMHMKHKFHGQFGERVL
jgi:hypothetical protein